MNKLLLMITVLCSAFLLCSCDADTEMQDGSESVPEQIATQATSEMNLEAYPTSKPPEETLVPDATDIDTGATSLEQFVYEIRADGTAVILDFTGSDTELVITSQIGGYPVTEIGQYAFEAAWDVTSVVLPDTIEIINEQAFADCESLSQINIPEKVTSIGRGAFSNCISLSELTLPAGVTETQEEMLTNCLALQDLYVLNPSLAYANWGLEESETKCTIHASSDAVILEWAEQNNFPFKIEWLN